MAHDSLAGSPRFPPTRPSAVLALGGDGAARARAFDLVVRTYFHPAYEHVRARWRKSGDEARDLVQGFFLGAFERADLAAYEPDRGPFRTFLRVCLDRYVAHERRRAVADKRGGGVVHLDLDFDEAERHFVREVEVEPEERFDRAFVRGVFDVAVADLEARYRARGKERELRLFKRVVLQRESDPPPSYETLAGELGVNVAWVTNHLATARRHFRQRVLATLRELTASDDEYRSEARAVLGVEVEP